MGRCFAILNLALVLLWPTVILGGPAGGAMSPGKVRLVGKYGRVKLKEGAKAKTYFVVPLGTRMTLKAGGPTSLVILARTRGAARTTFDFALGDEAGGRLVVDLHPKVTRGLFIPIPAGSHELVVEASEPVVLRPVRVRRSPKKGEAVVAWTPRKMASPAEGAQARKQPVPKAPQADEPVAEKPTAEKPAADKPAVDEPAADKAAADKAAADPVADRTTPTSLLADGVSKSLMVLEVKVVGLDEGAAKPIAAALATGLAAYPQLTVTTVDDVRAQLTHEQSRALMECRDSSQCVARIASGLKTDWAVAGRLGRVGQQLTLTLSLMDVKRAATLARADVTLDSLDAAPAAMPALIARLLGAEGGGEKRFHLAQGQKVSLAVMNLKAEGLGEALASNLTQILSVELKRIEGTSVISRDDVTAMLQLEENKMMLGCDDASCMAEIGGALGVDKLVVGSVGKLAQSYVTTLRLIDVRNARVDGRVTETFRGEEEQLIRAVRHAGRRLFGIEAREGGRLAVSANQEGAELHLDGELLGTLPGPPATVDRAGRHLLRVSKSGYFDWQSEVYIDPGETTAVWSKLEARPERWYQKWWVWTVVGAVVVGGATTAGILLAPEQKPGRGEVVLP